MKLCYGFYRDTDLFAAKLMLRNRLSRVTGLHTEFAVSMIAIEWQQTLSPTTIINYE